MLRKSALRVLAAVAVLSLLAQQAKADFVTASAGAVTFDPGELVDPAVTGVVAAVGAAIVLAIIAFGVRWVIRMVKGTK